MEIITIVIIVVIVVILVGIFVISFAGSGIGNDVNTLNDDVAVLQTQTQILETKTVNITATLGTTNFQGIINVGGVDVTKSIASIQNDVTLLKESDVIISNEVDSLQAEINDLIVKTSTLSSVPGGASFSDNLTVQGILYLQQGSSTINVSDSLINLQNEIDSINNEISTTITLNNLVVTGSSILSGVDNTGTIITDSLIATSIITDSLIATSITAEILNVQMIDVQMLDVSTLNVEILNASTLNVEMLNVSAINGENAEFSGELSVLDINASGEISSNFLISSNGAKIQMTPPGHLIVLSVGVVTNIYPVVSTMKQFFPSGVTEGYFIINPGFKFVIFFQADYVETPIGPISYDNTTGLIPMEGVFSSSSPIMSIKIYYSSVLYNPVPELE